MTLGMVRVTTAVGGVLLLVGAVLGLTGVSAEGVSCGRVFAHSTAAAFDAGCTDALSGRKAPVVVFLVLGAVVVAASMAMGWVLSEQERARREGQQ